MISRFILLFILLFNICNKIESQSNRVLLRDITSLTLRRGDYTTGRRSSSIPQLECIGGTAAGKFSPKVVQCYNRGFDGIDVQWECKSQMNSDYEFGKISVSCEGFDTPNDPYILAGSCGLKYELDYTASGAKRQSFSRPSNFGFDISKLVYLGISCFIIYLIYTSLKAPREGNEGDRRNGGGFDNGPGYPPGGGGSPPPPGWRDQPPSYGDSCKYNSGCGGSYNRSSSTGGNNGPGFFTGLGLGALSGYLFGGNNTGYGDAYRRRTPYTYNQYDNDAGFYDQPSTSYFSSSDRPSTSHSSSGFGSTTRR